MHAWDAAHRYLPHSRGEATHKTDWDAAPARFKRYRDAERLPLDWENGDTLSRLLRELYGLTRIRWSYPFWASSWLAMSTSMESHGFPAKVPPLVAAGRTIPSGGALYPSEVYLARGPALYHYDPAHHALDTVRPGDHRAALAGCLTNPPDEPPELVLVLTTTFWRTAFKYREFTYRLQAQETGVLIAQALCLADFGVHLCFADERVNRMLGLDSFRETAMAVLTLPGSGDSAAPSYEELVTVACAEVVDPPPTITKTLSAMATLHTAVLAEPCPADRENPLMRATPDLAGGMPFRASPRSGFARDQITSGQLHAILSAAGQPESAHTSVYCVVNNVEGVAPGAYRYDGDLVPCDSNVPDVPDASDASDASDVPAASVLSAVATRWAPWTRLSFHESAAAVFAVGDYERGIAMFGDRWVRMQDIEAGVLVQRAALAAAAVGLVSRINSDGTTTAADAALNLTGTARSLAILLVGMPRLGASVDTASRAQEKLCCDLARETDRRPRS